MGIFLYGDFWKMIGQTGPSSIACLWLNTLADLSQNFSILSDLKCFRSAFSCSTNHLGNAKPKDRQKRAVKISKAKGPAKKSSKENTCFLNCKMLFFHFSSVWPLLLSTLITFLLILNNLKCCKNTIWNSENHLWTLIATEQHKMKILSVWELTFVMFSGLFFWVLEPLYFEGV